MALSSPNPIERIPLKMTDPNDTIFDELTDGEAARVLITEDMRQGVLKAGDMMEKFFDEPLEIIETTPDMDLEESVEVTSPHTFATDSLMRIINESLGVSNPAWIAYCDLGELSADEAKETDSFVHKHQDEIYQNISVGALLMELWFKGIAKGRRKNRATSNNKPVLIAIKTLEASLSRLTKNVVQEAKSIRRISISTNEWSGRFGSASVTMNLVEPGMPIRYAGSPGFPSHPLKAHVPLLRTLPKISLMMFQGDNVENLVKELMKEDVKNMDFITRGVYVVRALKHLSMPPDLMSE